ncbi:FAD-dependent oxidoreductase [Rhodovulum sp. ES.010]|uniref:FAD-dependent oxidoreductase n=1 Tax=Rhodovulum sp. ES.010 TaxID=1882821 RepID=UPI0021102298|nr:FAD-dependent oxidoreductase [Rhodovulum sp. ES.010]
MAFVGGAVMGASAAFWLWRLGPPDLRIVVVEPDPGGARASTALAVASIRQQFSTAINVRIARYGIDCRRNIAAETGPHPVVVRGPARDGKGKDRGLRRLVTHKR